MDEMGTTPGKAWKVPGYLLTHPLGRGADATVWQAAARRTGAAVAVKLIPATEPGRREAARAEAATLAALDHPHLVRLHATVPCAEGLALVLDLAGGGSLREVLAARGRLAPGEVVTALAPIGAALAYAHNAGVLHGDVSAANVLFTESGLSLLSDLGLARLRGDAPSGPLRCTPAYIDPVVAAGGIPTRESDVFMLAAVALHALTGQPPWPGAQASEVVRLAALGELDDVGSRLRDASVPGAVAQVVRAGLDPDPAARPTAAEFALDLRHAATPVAVGLRAGRARHRAGEPSGQNALMTYGRRLPTPALPPPRRWARGWPWGWSWGWSLPRPGRRATGVLGCCAVVAGVGLWLSHGSGATAPPAAPAPAPARLDASGVRAVLAGLDAARARAYAGRDPSVLTEVYASDALRVQDVTQLAELVPAGCVLVGVHTDYRDVAVTSRRADDVVLSVRASQAAATLTCHGKPAGHTAASPVRQLRIALHRSGGSYRIAELDTV